MCDVSEVVGEVERVFVGCVGGFVLFEFPLEVVGEGEDFLGGFLF